MLMAGEVALPKCVYAHGWLLVGGEKMSKSKLTGIAPSQIVDHFGSDAFRYYFMKAIQFGQDGSFSWEDMSARYTSDLANGLGNLASRAAAMVGKYCEGNLPAPTNYTAAEIELQELLVKTAAVADEAICDLDFARGINAVKEFIDAVNLYVTVQEPWKVAKSEDAESVARLHTILYTISESLRAIAVLYAPVMPKSSKILWDSLGGVATLGSLDSQLVQNVATWGQLPVGSEIVKTESLFPRLEETA
jgi:methionyl-tRNA synthetase